MSKRILSLVLALVMVLGAFGTVFAAETGNEKIDWLIDQGIVKGDASGNLMLDKNIDRASVAKMVVEALGQQASAAGMQGIKSVFADVPAGHWSNGNINVVHGLGLMIGNNGKFMPSSTISYAEVVTILVRMMNGFTAEEAKTAVWPASYIAKANELGILDEVTVANFSAPAVRKDILEMFYNAMVNKEVGNYTIVKAIVLENDRVEALGKNEVVVEIIKEVQRANYVEDSRYERGDQENFVIDAKVGDVENLLGKVADFTLNKDGKVVKVTVDETYKVVEGPIVEATKGKLEMDRVYTVELDERYNKSDERVFRTYHNDKAYAYEDFYKDVKKADYARVTVKNGKVLYVNAFTFEDIAPVQEVKKDGAEVYIYNDQRDARVEKYAPATVIGYTAKDGFNRIEKADIKANDVVHVYTVGRDKNMIVRQDALVEGTYSKVSEGTRDKFYVHVDDAKYFMNDVNFKRPVFAHDSKDFRTLFAKDASSELRNFKDAKVTVMKDINGHLQYIGAGIEYNESITIIDQILSRGQVRYIKANNDKMILDETYDSYLKILGSTTNQKMGAFNRGDLTYVINDGENIDTMVRMNTVKEIRDNAKLVEKDVDTKFDINNNYVKMADGKSYQVLNRTNVFRMSISNDGNYTVGSTIVGTTVEDVRKGAKSTSDLSAFVITDKQFEDMKLEQNSRTSGRIDVAHTIIFLDYTGVDASLDYQTIRVTRKYTATLPHAIEGYDADGNPVYKELTKKASQDNIIANVNVDDIVELGINKDEAKEVSKLTKLIAYNAESYRVVDMDSRTDYRWILLGDKTYDPSLSIAKQPNSVKEFWTYYDLEEFGTVAVDDVVTFDTDNGYISVIRSYPKTKEVTGLFTGNNDPGTIATGIVTYINATGTGLLTDNSAEVVVINETTVLRKVQADKTVKSIGIGTSVIFNLDTSGNLIDPDTGNLLNTGDQIKVEGNVITILADKATLDAAAAKVVTDMINALPAAADVELTHEGAIVAARAKYTALTATQQGLVTLTKLTAAEGALKTKKDAAAAAPVIAKITALPAAVDVTLAHKAAIESARADFTLLTADQKTLVTLTNLIAAEGRITALETAKSAVESAATALTLTIADGSIASPVVTLVADAAPIDYAYEVSATTPATLSGGGKATLNAETDVTITRDTDALFTFEITVTVSHNTETSVPSIVKTFVVTVPTFGSDVTIAVK